MSNEMLASASQTPGVVPSDVVHPDEEVDDVAVLDLHALGGPVEPDV